MSDFNNVDESQEYNTSSRTQNNQDEYVIGGHSTSTEEGYAVNNNASYNVNSGTGLSALSIPLGAIGAFLGSLIGVVVIVIIGQLGYVAAIGGVIMGFCALGGYSLFARRLGPIGAIVTFIIVMIMVYVANSLDYVIWLLRESGNSIFDFSIWWEAHTYIQEEVALGNVEGYWFNLILLYIFTIGGCLGSFVGAFRSRG